MCSYFSSKGRISRFVTGVIVSCLIVVTSSMVHAQQQSVKDVLNEQNTPVLESIAQCLPAPVVDVDRAASQFWFSLIASVDAPSGSQFHYVNVFVDYETPASSQPPDLTTIYPWTTLVELRPDGSCQNLMPEEPQSRVSLLKFMPLEQGTQLAVARYQLELTTATERTEFQKYLNNVPFQASEPGSEMDAIPSRDQDIEAPRICELNPEEVAAVTKLGYSHQCRIRSVQ